MENNILFLMAIGALVGAASGYLGSFMVLKRMSLVGDALSHVALPGMAIALTFGFNPMLGALTALIIAIVGIWYLGEKSEVYPEALVGIFFTASLAIGILITPEPELLEALFGSIENVTLVDGVVIAVATATIFVVTKIISKKLLLGTVSEDLAKAGGVDLPRINLVYLLLVGLVVALGVKFLGTLLTGALVIVPAAGAKNISGSMSRYYLYSIAFGAVSAAFGIVAASLLGIAVGPIVVLVSVAIFVLTYIFKGK